MNPNILIYSSSLIFFLSGCQNEGNKSYLMHKKIENQYTAENTMQKNLTEIGEVLYMDFDIDPIVGYHQEDIENQGIHCKIVKSDFVKALINNPKFEFYNLALKAKISFKEDTYWIDNNGTVYSDKTKKTWSIDKKIFVDLLKNCK